MGAFDDLIPAGASGGAFDDLIPRKKRKPDEGRGVVDTAKDYGSAVAQSVGEGALSIQARAGTLAQAPISTAQSWALGGLAAADRGVTKLINHLSPGLVPEEDTTGVQRAAQGAARDAAAQRSANVNADGGSWLNPRTAIARVGLGLEQDARAREDEIAADNAAEHPELVRQQKAVQDAEGFFPTLKAVVQNPLATTYTLGRSLPDMLAGMGLARGAAMGTMRGAGAAGDVAAVRAAAAGGDAAAQAAAAKAAVAEVADQAVAQASRVGTLAEAGSSATQAREDVYREVAAMPPEKLAQSPRFREVLAQNGGNFDKAREALANELADQAAVAGVGTLAGSAVTRRIFGGDTTAKAIVGAERTGIKDVVKNIAEEGTEEGLQGVPEDLAQYGASVQADPSKKFDVGGSLAQNISAGMIMGGGGTGARATQQAVQDLRKGAGDAGAPAAPGAGAVAADEVLGKRGTDDWKAFPAETGTLGVPRADMPQIASEHRGALVNYLEARGIGHEDVELDAGNLKPTQAEYSPSKVEQFAANEGNKPERSVLVSNDGYVLDGHHQWLAAAAANEPVKAIRLEAPIRELLQVVPTFPSARKAEGSTTIDRRTEAEQALAKPSALTALDRVNEIDGQLASRAADSPEAAALRAERDQITATWPAATPGAQTSFTTEAGARLSARYALVNIGDLVTSHNANLRPNPAYPVELQPRDRERAASATQIAGIVSKLDPARLGQSADAATGAPIIGADGLVESGNARTIALARVYGANGQKAEDYKAWLRENSGQFGLTPEAVDALAKPVLVRVRTTPVNRAEFARQANASTVAQMSPAEQARSDANRIDSMEDLRPDEDGDFATSREFIRRFVGRLPPTEQSGMIDASGQLSSTGYARVRNAVLAKAYGESPVLARMVESMDDRMRNISRALMIAAPTVAQARMAIAEGARFDADITPDLVEAVEIMTRLKEQGGSVDDALAQAGVFGEQFSPEVRALMAFLAENVRRPRRIAEFITAYFQALDAVGDPRQDSLLGATEPPAKGELLNAARRNTQGAIDDAATTDTQRGEATPDRGEAGRQPENAPGDRGGSEGDGTTGPSQEDELSAARRAAVDDFKAAAAKLADLATRHTRAAMLPEDHPGLMPVLVDLFDAAIRIVGTDLKAATRWVKKSLRDNPATKAIWNKIPEGAYAKAALQALDGVQGAGQQTGLFATAEIEQPGLPDAALSAQPKGPVEIPEGDFARLMRALPDDEWNNPFVPPVKTTRIEDAGSAAGVITPAQAQERLNQWKAHARRQGESGKNAGKVVLSLFDASGEWSKPWREAGYDVFQFDIQDGMDINDFSVEYLTAELGLSDVYAVLAAPPCTDFSSSGAHAWAQKDADGRTKASIRLVDQTLNTIELFKPAVWALENPVGRIAKLANLPKPRMTFQPANFGDAYTKRTLLWGDFETDLPLANVAPTEGSKITNKLTSTDKFGRSLTPEGFAYAFFMANNAADLGAAESLAREFRGMDRAALRAAVDVGMSETAIRSAIEDSFHDGDLDAALASLRKAMPTTIKIDGKAYALDAPHFGMPEPPRALPADHPLLQETIEKATVVVDGAEQPREAWRNSLVESWFAGREPARGRKPVAYVMGGGGASGKGTILAKLAEAGEIPLAQSIHIDPDEFKLRIPEYSQIIAANDTRASSRVHEESSLIGRMVRERAGREKYDIVLVTLGDPVKGEKTLRDLKAEGYEVRLYGVTVDPRTAVVRALVRAERTFRYVPIDQLLLAHKGFTPAFERYAGMVDQAVLYENTNAQRELARKGDGGLVFHDQAAYNMAVERSANVDENAGTLRGIEREPSGSGTQPLGRGVGRGPLERDRGRDAGGTGGAAQAEGSLDRSAPGPVQGLIFDEPAPNRRAGPEGQGTQAAPGAGGKRRTAPLPGRSDEPDLFGEPGSDAAAAAVAAVGRPGPSGVRGADENRAGAEPRGRARRPAAVPAGRDIGPKSGLNYRFGDNDLTYEGSWAKKAAANVDAVELLKRLETEGRQATRDEQRVLAQFVGWGASEVANAIFGKKAADLGPRIEAFNKAKEMTAGGKDITADNIDYWTAYQYLAPTARMGYRQPIPASAVTAKNFGFDASDVRWHELRERLKAALTPEEWADAARSTQYAHYTSKSVVRSMWNTMERFGFKGGAMLEPGAGIGVFAGLMPEAMAFNSSYTGIEFDPITGGILKQLFPDERILVESFIDSKLPRNFYDVAVGNPPFSGTKVLTDTEYQKQAFSLHDYFFAKTIDRVKPGGLVVFVTSRYTMDKLNDKAREYLAERADLVGAIRLPQTAFKQNAGTDVVTDVLFLRKKVDGETFEHAQPWGKSVPMKVGKQTFPVNEYYHAHPEMVLGTHSDSGTMQNSPEPQYTVLPGAGDIEAAFSKAAATLPADIYQAQRGSDAEAAKVREIDWNPKAQKEGNYYLSDKGVLMQREGGVGAKADVKPADVEAIKAFIPLRDALKQAHFDQLNDGDWEPSLKALQAAYKAFVRKHGLVNQFVTKTVKVKVDELDDEGNPTGRKVEDEEQRRVYPFLRKVQDDPDWTLVAALEKLNDETGEIKPSGFLTGRVLGKPAPAQIATPHDALLSTLNDLGRVDITTIAARLGVAEADAIEALGSAVYNDPETGWQTSDEYLSGNVKRKLEVARAAAQADRKFERNVKALEAAQPAPKTPAQISPSIGMNWIPGSDYAQFLRETAGVRAEIRFNEATRQWIVNELAGGRTLASTADWGTLDRPAADLMMHALSGRPIRVTRTVGSGANKTTVFDAAATEAANQKLDALREEFGRWIWRDADRANRLVQVYNDTFNTTVPRSFDGRHLTLPGASTQFHIFDHVKRGAWRIIQRGNTYLAHAVGSGKTFQMVIAAMEQKRLGLIRKPMMVVPNHMLQQFAREWQELYPAAKLMVADEHNFHTDNRRRFVSRVALSDLDGVVITHSAFKLMDLDPAFKSKIVEEQLDYLRAALEEAESEGKRSPRVKQIEKQIENLEQKLGASMSSEGKDRNVRFDELGVDQLFVDEAHEFRKLDYATARQVKGIQPTGSARSLDLYIKARYLDEKHPGRSLVMASGTPVTNTLAELYTVQRFMDRKALKDRGLEDFDSWAAMFGRERTALEPNAAGKYEPVTRFSKFVNVPELTQMFREYADVVTADQLAALLGDKRPKVEGGSRQIIVTPKSRTYGAYQKELARRVQVSRDWKPSRDEPSNPDPIIRIIGDGRLAAIDMRFVTPGLANDPDSKLNKMLDDVIAALKETADFEYLDKADKLEPQKGATLMVFSDLGFGAGVAASRGFNARAWAEKRLRDAGIPASKVAFMSDYKKSTDKLKLFQDVNAGRVRALFGSSKNMGTGVNAQQRLKDEFHLDSPWYPADLEQREGRIIRQGNKNKTVRIKAYAAKGTYDENMWKMLASKQYFIDQALNGDENLREIEDLDSQSQYDLAAAMVAEDPRVMQLAGARAEIEKLDRLFKAHEDQRMAFRTSFRFAQEAIAFNEKHLPEAEALAAKVQDLSGDKFTAKVGRTSYTDRVEWGSALLAEYKRLTSKLESTQQIGEISRVPIRLVAQLSDSSYRAHVRLETPTPTPLITLGDESPVGLAMRAQNALVDIKRQPAAMRDAIAAARSRVDALRERLETPFPMAGMLADKVKEAASLEAELAAAGKPRAWRVERVDTGLGHEVQATSAEEAIDKAVETNGGTPAEWRAIEGAQPGAAPPAEGTKLSRGAAGGIAYRSLLAVASRIALASPGLPPVKVMLSPADAPQALQDFIRARGAMADAEGAFHDGRIYLFASGIADELRAEHVLAEHEAAHVGLAGMLGKGLPVAMQAIANNNAAVRKAAVALQKANPGMSTAEAVEEVLADMPTAALPALKGWRGLVGKVRDWLAGHGYAKLAQQLDTWLAGHLTEQQRADLAVADLVRAARAFVRATPGEVRPRQGVDSPGVSRVTRLSTATTADQAPPSAADRAEAIIQASASTPKPLDAAARLLTRITGVERAAALVGGLGARLIDRLVPERVKAGFVSDYGVPEAVIDQRAMMQGRQREALRGAGVLLEKLATLTRAESRVAYEWMTGEDTRSADELMQALPPESVKVLTDVRAMVDRLSTEAVRLGQLDAEAFQRHRFAYLRRSYFKHAIEMTGPDKARRQRAITILGDQYRGRGMTDAAPMRQIQNGAPAWWKRKVVDGKADTSLKGEKFVRYERRAASGEGTAPIEGMEGKQPGKLLEINYWPAGEPAPAKYGDWENAGTWEAVNTKGGDVIMWRDFTKAEREKMGEIDEARFAIAKTLQGMIHDIEVGRYLEWLAQQHGKKPGETIAGTVVEASERYRDTFKPGEWVQVPDTKVPGTSVAKYGKLAGHYLPGPIWNDLRQVVNGQFKPLGETFARIQGMWKVSKTALSPAVHTNNIMSNFVMADWHDVTAGHVAKALRIMLGAHQRDGRGAIGRFGNAAARAGIGDAEAARQILARYADSGGAIGGWVTQEIANEQLEPIVAALEAELADTAEKTSPAEIGIYAALQHALGRRFPAAWEALKGSKPVGAARTEAASLIELYQAEDDVFRLAAWLKAKEAGMADAEAGKVARRSFLDYSINAPWVQAMRSTAFPFISFTYRAVPMLLDTAAKKPHKLLKLMALAGALNWLGVMLAGGGDDKERKLLPEEKAGRVWGLVPKLVRLPWNDAHGSPVYLDIRRWIPVGDVADLGQGHSALPIPPALMPGGPLAMIGEVALNKTSFTGKPITLDTDTATEKAGKIADYLWKASVPNLLGVPDTYATQGVVDAVKGRTDTFGREQSVAQALASSVGVKVGSYPADVLRRNLLAKANAEVAEIDHVIAGLRRQRATNQISPEEFQSAFRTQREKEVKIRRELGEKVN